MTAGVGLPGAIVSESVPAEHTAERASRGVMAAVVTFQPGGDLRANLSALRGQIETVVVIDNGSANHADVASAVAATGCRLVSNGANLGIAAALNAAVRIARSEGFEWLATFDQDSLIPLGAVAGLLDVAASHPASERIGIVAMSHRDRAAGRDYHRGWDVIEATPTWRSVRTTITSGSFIRVRAFDGVGVFDEQLFIDSVDHDVCLRCRRRGLLVIEARDQVMAHSIGAVTVRNVLGRRVVWTNHSPDRRYYITRNTLEVVRRNLAGDFAWAAYALFDLSRVSLTVLVFEKQRLAKAWAILAGAGDFLLRRFGPRRPARHG